MNVNTQKFQSQYDLVHKPSARRNQRTTLPQSRVRSTAPSEREPGTMGRVPFNVSPGKSNVAGDFHRPYERRFPFIVVHSLSLAFARQLPQRGSRGWVRGLVPFNQVLAKPEGCGRFSSPLRNSEILTLYHSPKYTPSVSHSLDSSLREGAGDDGAVPFNVPPGKREGAGDFHRPYESSEYFTAQKLPVSGAKTIPGGAGHLRMGTSPKRN